MSQTLITTYASEIDNSTPSTRAQTLHAAANRARVDSNRDAEKAREMRTTAAGYAEMGSSEMALAAEELNNEAAALEDDSEKKLAIAAALSARAGEESSAA